MCSQQIKIACFSHIQQAYLAVLMFGNVQIFAFLSIFCFISLGLVFKNAYQNTFFIVQTEQTSVNTNYLKLQYNL